MSTDSRPWNAGYQAFFNACGISDNPYEYGTADYEAWREGWKEAQSDDDASHDFSTDTDLDGLFDSIPTGDDDESGDDDY